MRISVLVTCGSERVNLLPNTGRHILQVVLYIFPKVLKRRICQTIKSFFLLVIISFILVTIKKLSTGHAQELNGKKHPSLLKKI